LSNEANLVTRAADLLKKVTGYRGGAHIEIKKTIPLSSGLAGGSSDAAGTLIALTRLWGTGISDADLLKVALELGSDVPFFLRGGMALVEGRGEILTPLDKAYTNWYNLLVPPLLLPPDKTGHMYTYLQESHFSDGSRAYQAAELARRKRPLPERLLYNTFELVMEEVFPQIRYYYEAFQAAGAMSVHLSGSGPSLFSVSQSNEQALEVHERLKMSYPGAYLIADCNSNPVIIDA
jgi:4-diphosphocytidyl-2-C-methyl-D-erythritol kinase